MAIKTIIAALIAVLVVVGFSGLYNLATFHDRTLIVENTKIDYGDGKSYYLVYGEGGQIVELERQWWQWGSNIDLLFNEVEKLKGKQITLGCWGIVFNEWYWYSNCYELKNVI